MNNKYLNWKIYFLKNKINNSIVYIGSWILPLKTRYWIHKNHWIINPKRKIYKFINEIGIDNIYIILYKNFPCNNKKELKAEEKKCLFEIWKNNFLFNTYNPINEKTSIEKLNKIKNYYQKNKNNPKNFCNICCHQFKNSAHKKEHLYWQKHTKNLLKIKIINLIVFLVFLIFFVFQCLHNPNFQL